MAGNNLGQLFYSLGLKSEDFDAKIKSIAETVRQLNNGGKITIDTRELNAVTSQLSRLKSDLSGLEGVCKVTMTGVPTNVDMTGTINIDSAQIKAQVESALSGLVVRDIQVDTSSAKAAFMKQMWNVNVTTDQSSIKELVNRVKSVLGLKGITIKVTPDMSKTEVQKIKTTLERELKNLNVSIRVKADRKLLQEQLNNMHLTANVDIRVNKSSAATAVQNAVNGGGNLAGGNSELGTRYSIQDKITRRATDELGVRRSINDQMSKNTQLATILGNAMGNVFGAYMIKNFLENLIQIGGEIQKQRMALGHIIDNISNANALFEQMKQLAVKSPFGLLDLMKNARQLSAFGVEYNQLYDTMKRLSDMAAGLGIQFSRLALAYGETKERGFLDGKLVRQFSYMGLPVLQKVAEYYTQIDKLQNGGVVTAAQVRSMVSDKQVSFEDVDAVIKKMTEEGGQFYNMQEVMAESVAGKWKNLKDAIDIMYSDIVEGNSDILKMPAEFLTKLTRNYDQLLIILTALGTRLVGTRIMTAMNTAIVSANTTALALNKKETIASTAAAVRRNGTFAILNKTEKMRIANIQSMNAGELKNLIIKGQLNKGDLERLIMMERLSAEQKQLIVGWGYMTAAEVKAAEGATRFGMAMKTAGAAVKSFFSFGNIFTIGLFALMEIGNYFYKSSEKAKQFAKDVQQSMDDFRKATASVQDEVGNLDYGNMSFGERETEIKNMVEYIKDNVPDAERKLAEIFKTDSDGKFVNDTEARFNKLKAIVKDMETLSLKDVEGWAKSASKVFDQFDIDDSTADFFKSRATIIKQINNALGGVTSELRNNILSKFKEDYKKELMNAFNISNEEELKNKTQSDIVGIVTGNKQLLTSFLESNKNVFGQVISSVKGFNGDYKNSYEDLVKTVTKSIINLRSAIEQQEGIKNLKDSQIFWGKQENRDMWNRTVDITVQTDFKEKSSDEQKLIKQLMNDPVLLTYINLQSGNVDAICNKVLSDEMLSKNLFLNIIPMYDGSVTEDPYKDWMNGIKGKVNTDKTFVGNADMIREQLETSYKALKQGKALKWFKNMKSESDNVAGYLRVTWSATSSKVSGEMEQAVNDMNTFQKNFDQAMRAAIEAGMDASAILKAVDAKDNKKGGSSKKEDTVLKGWKEEFDEIKKIWDQFKKWEKVVGREDAANALFEQGLISKDQISKIVANKDYFEKLIEEFKKKISGSISGVEREKFFTSVKAYVGDIKLEGIKEAAQKAVEKAQKEINDVAKQWDIYKAWFEATGDKDTALQMSVAIKPMFNEQADDLMKMLEKGLEGSGITISEKWFSKDVLQSNMKEIFGNLTDQYDIYKAIYDLVWKTGEEHSKQTANTLKDMMTFEQKIAVLEKEREEALKGANGNAQLEGLINAKYDSKVAELDPEYKRYMSAVTTMTKEAALNMANTIKERLVRDLQTGAKDIEAYAKAVEQVDSQLEKSMNRIDSFGKAWLMGKLGDYYKNNVTTASYNKATAAKNAQATGIALAKALQKNQENPSVASETELQKAIADNTTAQENLKKASEELTEAEQKLLGYNKSTENANVFAAGLQKVNSFVSGVSGLADALANMDDNFSVLKDVTSVFSSATNRSSQLQAFGSAISNTGGTIGAIVGAFLGTVEGLNASMKQLVHEDYEDTMKIVKEVQRVRDTIKEGLEYSASKLYSGLDSETTKALEELVKKYTRTTEVDVGSSYKKTVTDVSYVGQKAQDALNSNSYYKAQIAFMEEQKKQLEQQKTSMEMSADKYVDDSEYEDVLDQIANVKKELKYLAQDMAKELYGIDFTSYATTIADSIVGAWQKGEDAVVAYKNSVSDMLASVAKSVVSQKIIGKYLDEVMDPWLEQFSNAGGVMDDDLFEGLNIIFQGLEQKVGESEVFLDKWEELAQKYGRTLKTDESNSSTSNSIKSVSEETADILAAYINEMRLDLSLQRLAVGRIAEKYCGEEGEEDTGTVIARSQLQQLEMIASNTYNTYQELVALNERFDAVNNGTKRISIQ